MDDIPNGKYRFNTYDNVFGTIPELLNYFEDNCIKGRKLELPEDSLLVKQLEDIRNTNDKQGTVIFIFDEGKKNSRLLEKIYVLVKE